MKKVAIILNNNARSVTDDSIYAVTKAALDVGGCEVFLSNSVEKLDSIIDNIIDYRADVVMCGGGDGTFATCVTKFYNKCKDNLPAFGILRLGTGNALADVLGVCRSYKTSLELAKRGMVSNLSMLKIKDKIAPFAGIGLDAMILEDYETVKGELNEDPVFKIIESQRGPMDYGLAISLLSFWKVLMGHTKSNVTITNVSDSEAYQIDEHGFVVGNRKGKGETIYHGTAGMIAGSTVPYYGMGFKMFPQVNPSAEGFQLRVINLKIHELITSFPFFIMGDIFHKHITDYHCKSVSIKMERNVPFQLGGDSMGKTNALIIDSVQIPVVLGRHKVKELSDERNNYR